MNRTRKTQVYVNQMLLKIYINPIIIQEVLQVCFRTRFNTRFWQVLSTTNGHQIQEKSKEVDLIHLIRFTYEMNVSFITS